MSGHVPTVGNGADCADNNRYVNFRGAGYSPDGPRPGDHVSGHDDVRTPPLPRAELAHAPAPDDPQEAAAVAWTPLGWIDMGEDPDDAPAPRHEVSKRTGAKRGMDFASLECTCGYGICGTADDVRAGYEAHATTTA